MERVQAPRHDPDLDPLPPRMPLRPLAADPYYQRLVANPFLALLALLIWGLALRRAFFDKNLPHLLVVVAALGAIPWLLQYHCRDCGSTGALLRWRRHACEPALARQQAGRRRLFRAPNPTNQTIIWGYVLALIAFFTTIALHSRH